jgi:hypothetical protein
VLRRIFGPKREKVTLYWRKLHNEEFHTLYHSPNVIRVTALSMVRGAVYTVHCRDEKCIYKERGCKDVRM